MAHHRDVYASTIRPRCTYTKKRHPMERSDDVTSIDARTFPGRSVGRTRERATVVGRRGGWRVVDEVDEVDGWMLTADRRHTETARMASVAMRASAFKPTVGGSERGASRRGSTAQTGRDRLINHRPRLIDDITGRGRRDDGTGRERAMRDGERMTREVCEATDENGDDDVDARAQQEQDDVLQTRRRFEWCVFAARIPNERIKHEDDARGTNDRRSSRRCRARAGSARPTCSQAYHPSND